MMKRIKNYKLVLLCVALVAFSCKKKSNSSPDKEEEGFKYETTTTIFSNPERGTMKMFAVYSEGNSLNEVQLQSMRAQNLSLIQRIYYFEKFKNKALSQAELTLIQTDFDKIRENGLKVILRFAYSDYSDDATGADAPLAIVEQHLDQLKPLFETNKDVIAFVQAGLIGPWGEWHDSTNGLDNAVNQTKVLNKLLSVLPTNIMVQVRTPGQKQAIFNTTLPLSKELAYTADNRARVGHHNDCFMTGGTNYGTYVNIVADKQYISNEALYVPTGGETCPPGAGYSPNCMEARNEMKLLKWTYLNLDYYQPTLNIWRNTGCFDELQRSMGYRIAFVSSVIPATATLNGSLNLSVKLTNLGFAPVYHKKDAVLVLKNKATGQFINKALTFDIRTCKPSPITDVKIEEAVSLTGVPVGEYDLYIKIEDEAANLKSNAAYSIRFANKDTWSAENGGLNSLLHSIKVN